MEENLRKIANSIFNTTPKDPCSIDLQLDTDNSDQFDDSESDKVVSEILSALMCYGIQILFNVGPETGIKVNVGEITDQQLEFVNKYFNSFGWEIILTKTSLFGIISFKNIISNKILSESLTLRN